MTVPAVRPPEPPPPPHCHVCGHVVAPYYRRCPQCEGLRNREKVDRLAEVIRELKEAARYDLDPERERELSLALVELGHPDPKGLLQWIANERAKPAQPKRRGGG